MKIKSSVKIKTKFAFVRTRVDDRPHHIWLRFYKEKYLYNHKYNKYVFSCNFLKGEK